MPETYRPDDLSPSFVALLFGDLTAQCKSKSRKTLQRMKRSDLEEGRAKPQPLPRDPQSDNPVPVTILDARSSDSDFIVMFFPRLNTTKVCRIDCLGEAQTNPFGHQGTASEVPTTQNSAPGTREHAHTRTPKAKRSTTKPITPAKASKVGKPENPITTSEPQQF